MKVVINACYGGFSLSAFAVKRLAERKGRPCYFFVQPLLGGKLSEHYEPVSVEDAAKAILGMFSAFDIPNPDILAHRQEWREMTMAERKASNDLYAAHSLEVRPEPRHDPDLVAVVEELGKRANGACAALRVVEIPDGVDYEIEEYDGNEHIAEIHRTWR